MLVFRWICTFFLPQHLFLRGTQWEVWFVFELSIMVYGEEVKGEWVNLKICSVSKRNGILVEYNWCTCILKRFWNSWIIFRDWSKSETDYKFYPKYNSVVSFLIHVCIIIFVKIFSRCCAGKLIFLELQFWNRIVQSTV